MTGITLVGTQLDYTFAQPFTTGDNPYGYVLESVVLNFRDFEHNVQGVDVPPAVTVSVCPADGSGNPGTPCDVLANPGTLVDFGDTGNSNTFTAPPGATLKSRTTYIVVAEARGGLLDWVSTVSTDEDDGKASGWSIGNSVLGTVNDGGWQTATVRLHIAINGHEADRTAPRVSSIVRQIPTAYHTAANTLTWRVTFSEDVENMDEADFTVSGTTASVAVTAVTDSSTAYDVALSGGDLAGVNGRVSLAFAPGLDIVDGAGHDMVNTRPTGTSQSSYLVDNAAPKLVTAMAKGTKVTLTFDEALDTSSVPADNIFRVKVATITQTAPTGWVAIS